MKSTVLNFYKKLLPSITDHASKVLLLYGPNYGLVNETMKAVKSAYVNKGYGFYKISSQDIKSTSEAIMLKNELMNSDMFAANKLIYLQGADKKTVEVLTSYLEGSNLEHYVMITEGALDTKSAIRSFAEKNDLAISVPCYEESEKSSAEYVKMFLQNNNIAFDDESLELLCGKVFSPDRQNILNSLQLLQQTCKSQITVDSVNDVFPQEPIANGIEELVINNIVAQNFKEAAVSLSKMKNTEGVALSLAILNALFKMLRILVNVKAGTPETEAIAKEFVFFKSIWAYKSGIRNWSVESVNKAIRDFIEIDIAIKKGGGDGVVTYNNIAQFLISKY